MLEIHKLNIEELSQNEKKDMEEILAKSKDATVFHTIEWNKILTTIFKRKNITFVAKIDGKPIGFYILYESQDSGPRTIYKSPETSLETVYGGPLVINGTKDEDVIKSRLIKQVEFEAKSTIVQISFPPGANTQFLRKLEYRSTPFYTSILDLARNEEELWANLHQKTRNLIRKSQRSGLEIIMDGRPYLPKYYEMVRETLGSQGVRVLPKKFYEEVIDSLEPKNMAKLVIAVYDGKAISGAIFLFYKDTVYYWHGASFRDHKSVAPNQSIQWELIKYANQNGYKKYDLLNIEPDRLPGIARFKIRFGGETKLYYRAVYKTPAYSIPLLAYCIRHPSYLYGRVKSKLIRLKINR
ncbi:MAG: lipid II:glycine glycyltransferase FemX [Candidatus Hodarchaeota archaeon]